MSKSTCPVLIPVSVHCTGLMTIMLSSLKPRKDPHPLGHQKGTQRMEGSERRMAQWGQAPAVDGAHANAQTCVQKHGDVARRAFCCLRCSEPYRPSSLNDCPV